MDKINSFEKLHVWEKSHKLVLAIYQLTKTFPPEERYSLVDQIRRSSSSVVANIVEGNEKHTRKEYLQFLYTAKGSLAETRYHLILARDLNYLPLKTCEALLIDAIEVSKMISGIIRYLKSDIRDLRS